MNNNNLISCQDLADIRYFLSKFASEDNSILIN